MKRSLILIVDDDADDRFMMKEAFEENKIQMEIAFAENGIDLINFLNSEGKYQNKGNELPSLIILDLNMPKMDGREAMQKIKSDEKFKHIPIAIFTTSKSNEDLKESYQLGANCYIVKPVTFNHLIETVKTFSDFWLNVASLPE